MFRVEHRFAGFGTWNTNLSPVTAQGAWGQAKGMDTPIRADQVRVVPTSGPAPRVDIKA
jgi:hypothetical protein